MVTEKGGVTPSACVDGRAKETYREHGRDPDDALCRAFGLAAPPFLDAADSSFLHTTAAWRRAFNVMLAALRERAGLYLLIGESGIGKSTLVARLHGELRRERCFVLCCANARDAIGDLSRSIGLAAPAPEHHSAERRRECRPHLPPAAPGREPARRTIHGHRPGVCRTPRRGRAWAGPPPLPRGAGRGAPERRSDGHRGRRRKSGNRPAGASAGSSRDVSRGPGGGNAAESPCSPGGNGARSRGRRDLRGQHRRAPRRAPPERPLIGGTRVGQGAGAQRACFHFRPVRQRSRPERPHGKSYGSYGAPFRRPGFRSRTAAPTGRNARARSIRPRRSGPACDRSRSDPRPGCRIPSCRKADRGGAAQREQRRKGPEYRGNGRNSNAGARSRSRARSINAAVASDR